MPLLVVEYFYIDAWVLLLGYRLWVLGIIWSDKQSIRTRFVF